ncbi:MAG: SBBP repeat-containing protein [Acidobacteria bacterium]|jgi:hypothetical protein|nr:SBBP repeat-containing protein [Acidobacteriota bacterium]
MKRLILSSLVVLVGIVVIFASISGTKVQRTPYSTEIKTPDVNSSAFVKKDPDFGKIPLYFIPNQGQMNKEVKFYAKTPAYTLWMTKEGLVFDSIKKVEVKAKGEERHPFQDGGKKLPSSQHAPFSPDLSKTERDVSRLIFPGANKNHEMVPVDLSQHQVNYLTGNDPSKWQAGIQTSKAVLFKDIYQNIDLKVYGIEKEVEYDWIVKPGSDPKAISFKYEQVSNTRIDREGNLVVKTKFGKLMHKKPESYQVINGKRVPIQSTFKKVGKNTYGFKVEKYNRDFELIIDPMVCPIFSTYLGGSSSDASWGIALDNNGNVYVTGYTGSTNFPTKNPYQGILNGSYYDAFVMKLSPEGTILYSTYLGGSSSDYGNGIAVDSNGSAYVTGYTYSTNFPTLNPYQGTQNGYIDAFVTKLSPEGDTLLFSTYLGGNYSDYGWGIAVDSDERAYVTGYTNSTNFHTKNACQGTLNGSYDAFVTKLSPVGKELLYSTYLGGSSSDYGWGIAVDNSESAYVTGYTFSTNFPIKNACQSTRNYLSDVFVTKFSPRGDATWYSTYLGGNGSDFGRKIAVDNSGCAYVTGETSSTNFPTKNPYQGILKGYRDSFVTRLSPEGNNLLYSTYLGGNGYDYGRGIAVDSNGSAYVTGYTDSTNFPTHNACQNTLAGGTDIFVARFCSCDPAPILAVNKTLLNFAINRSGKTGDQSFLIRNIGGGTLNWKISTDADFIDCNPKNGTNFGVVTVSVNVTSYPAGTYTGTITITDTNAINSPQTIAVTMIIYYPGSGLPVQPFGFFDTPGNGAVVNGSVPISGWALDDIDVVSVKLYHEAGYNFIYIGDAFFVEGARPDVAQIYPQYPNCFRAGWGYMMLTNLLPDGSYVLHAIAADKEGNRVTLGTNTITIQNSTAVTPFGTIDIPAPGSTASGNKYRFQGWALTPPPNEIPLDGVRLFIDGVDLGAATYNIFRQDIYDLFLGHKNHNGALAYYDFNTTVYDNGIHTVWFEAKDDANNTGAIGSRYFNIYNLGSIHSLSQAAYREQYSKAQLSDIPVDDLEPVKMIKGVNTNGIPEILYPGENGNTDIEIKEVERIEIHLNADEANFTYKGYLEVGEQLWPLPIGSTLDTERSIFYWSPGPGFIGLYPLVFVGKGPDGEMNKKLINVDIVPRFKK